ncbi:MAG: hypothetical protein O2975_09165 [Proteobacteria bacterium]|nr:hypothetical protein [Pseudomonadota bacterium]
MALADAAAKASGQAFADWHDDDTRRALARVAPDDMHPWSQGWRAMLAGTQAAIDWQAEAGFATLTWAEPALKPA